MQLRAPAKFNLSFKILGRRADSFHEIETLMTPVSLFDIVTITFQDESGKITLICDDPSLPAGEDNLVVRAARHFLATTGSRVGLSIDLQKTIPHGAGLGGGSSDAASVLLGLNRLLQTGLSIDELRKLGATIGSDVPFFLFESAANCRGRGELVEATTLPRKLSLLLLKPAFGVPTPWAYGRWKESKELPAIRYEAQKFSGFTFVNDLERPVFEKYVFLAQMKMWLLEQPEVCAALLSGSGSTVFAALRDEADADAVAARAKAELDTELWTYACETGAPSAL